MRRYKLTEQAAGDIREIFDYTQARFGSVMRERYVGLIRRAVADIVADPTRLGASRCPEFGDGVLTYHLRHVRREAVEAKVKAPRHLLLYRVAANGFISILRVLHDSMDVGRHVGNDN